jgi:hypothetical protein
MTKNTKEVVRPEKNGLMVIYLKCVKTLFRELSDEDSQGFRNFLRMDTRDFFLNNVETECSTNVHLLDIVHITAESAFCSSMIPLF